MINRYGKFCRLSYSVILYKGEVNRVVYHLPFQFKDWYIITLIDLKHLCVKLFPGLNHMSFWSDL